MIDLQQHPLANGARVTISRNGRHQYWVGEDGPKMKSVTGLLRHIDGDTFGIGVNWALKKAREDGGNLDAPKQFTKESLQVGNHLHQAIDDYITHGTINEDDLLWMAWYHTIGQQTEFLASERFLYHPVLAYGGTVDAISLSDDGEVGVHDWKSVEPASWAKYGAGLRLNKDAGQLGAYANALKSMGSVWEPSRGYITYVMRDGSGAETIEVDLERGFKLFQASRDLYLLTQGGG